MRKPGLIFVVLVVAVALGGSTWADHVINFANGTSLPVREYRIRDGMVHVDLGGNAFMAFPMELVEEIETLTRSLNLKPSTMRPDETGPMIASSARSGSQSRGGGAKTSSTHQRSTSGNPGSVRGSRVQDSKQRNLQTASSFAAAGYGANRANTRDVGGGGRAGAGMIGARTVSEQQLIPGRADGRKQLVAIEPRRGEPRRLPSGLNFPNPGTNPPKREGGSDK